MSSAAETARDIYRSFGLPPRTGAFAALVDALERAGRIAYASRRELCGCPAALDGDAEPWVILLARGVRGDRRLELVAHELAEQWLACERHDCVESDCDAVARELVRPTWVAGVQLRLAL